MTRVHGWLLHSTATHSVRGFYTLFWFSHLIHVLQKQAHPQNHHHQTWGCVIWKGGEIGSSNRLNISFFIFKKNKPKRQKKHINSTQKGWVRVKGGIKSGINTYVAQKTQSLQHFCQLWATAGDLTSLRSIRCLQIGECTHIVSSLWHIAACWIKSTNTTEQVVKLILLFFPSPTVSV